MTGATRFGIDRTTWVKPLLVLFTATASRSWVEVDQLGVRFRYGWYRYEVPFEYISEARREHWPWYAGIGWRTNFRSVIGLIGSYDGIVALTIDPPQRTRLLGIPFRPTQIYVSLEDASGFLEVLARHRVAIGLDAAAG